MKVALVCDWLTNVGGAERVLRAIADLFPSAPIYTSQYNKKKIDWFNDREVRTGWLQIIPSSLRRFIGPLRQNYFSHLDLSEYDLIISVTGAEAKSIKKGNALHLCYCHVPTQYYWGLKEDYIENPGFGILNPIVRLNLKFLLPSLKKADFAAAQHPDKFITISSYSAEQIKKAYKRESIIIPPPVAVEKFSTEKFSTNRETIKKEKSQAKESEQKNNKTKKSQANQHCTGQNDKWSSQFVRHGFVTTSRQVSWKRLDLAIKACLKLRLPLTVIGEGPEHKKLVKLAKESSVIKFVPLVNQESLKKYLYTAEGYIFPSLEPFGIAPVEALACGCPIIAYGSGGALDYVVDDENGVLFDKQSVNSLCRALNRFRTLKFNETKIKNSAIPFSETEFKRKLKEYILAEIESHNKTIKQNVKQERKINDKKVKSSPKKSC